MKALYRVAIVWFTIGAIVPLIWGIVNFALFNVPEGAFSEAFWDAVYITCPFWIIDGEKALILMPLLNGTLYTVIGISLYLASRRLRRD